MGEAQKSIETEKSEVEFANGFVQDAVIVGVGDAEPVELNSLQDPLDELGTFPCYEGLGLLELRLVVGVLAHALVALELARVRTQRNDGWVGEAVVGGESRLVEFGAEVAAERDEGVEGALVAEAPGDDAGEEDENAEESGGEGGEEAVAGRPEDPEGLDREEGEEGAVGEGDEAPEEAEGGPGKGFGDFPGLGGGADTTEAEAEDQGHREEPGGEGHVPGPVDGVLQGGGVEGPEPAGPEGDAAAVGTGGVAAVRDLVDGHGGGGGGKRS